MALPSSSRSRRLLLLCSAASSLYVPASAALAKDGAIDGVAAVTDQATTPPSETLQSAAEKARDAAVGDKGIIVTAPRIAGQLDTEIPPEVTLDEADIASYGASSLTELLQALTPQTRSGRGRGGGQPVVLVNGRRVSGFRELRNLTPDAIRKVEIFPEEVALQYGYSADERVINFILKPDFRSIDIEGDGGLATQGGWSQQELEANFLRISPNGRFNLTSAYERQDMLTEAERKLLPITGDIADTVARSLIARGDQYFIDATINRTLDPVTDAGASLRVQETNRLSLLGPGVGGVADPLERDSRTRTLDSGVSANGMVGRWRWSATGNYNDNNSRIFTDRLNGTVDRFDSSQQRFGVEATASGTLLRGWAGPVRMTLSGQYNGERLDSESQRGAVTSVTDLSRDNFGTTANLVLPLLDPGYGVGNIGRVSLSSSLGVRDVSDFTTLLSWSAGLNWAPANTLSLLVSFNNDEVAPGVQQLGDAPLVNPQVPFFDFTRGETVFIDTVSGGNPLLRAEQRKDLKLGLNWSVKRDISLSVNYNRNRSSDTSNAFPLLTPEIEAAFPDRVTRDANGQLERVDIRPVNYDRVANSEIRWGLNLSGQLATPPAATGGPPGAGRGPGGPGGPGRPGSAGRGPGGGGGAMMRGPQGGRWTVSAFHTVRLTDTILIRDGVPVLDLLNGSATGADGGSPRHRVEVDGGLFNNGIGARISARYDSGSAVLGGVGGSDLRFAGLATLNLRAWYSFDNRPKLIEKSPWLKGVLIRLSLDNVFDAQRKITDGTGAVPLRYQPGRTGPRGRFAELSIRKRF